MNSFRVEEKLSRRLKTLASYHHRQKQIWDIGCDHGLLGLSFLHKTKVQEIHLVDPSIKVIDKLKLKLKDSYITKPRIFIHHESGQNLKVERDEENIFFIAGMGGEEIEEIIEALLPQIDSKSRIVISPHRKILELRLRLSVLPLTLSKEEVLYEDGQFYQILCLGPEEQGQKVSLFGEELWKSETGKAYREHQLKFFAPHRDSTSEAYVRFLASLTP